MAPPRPANPPGYSRVRAVLTWQFRKATPMCRVITSAIAILVAATVVAAAAAVTAAVPAAAEDVEIPSGETTLKAVLFRPAGPGPFPAVVGLHGCGGLVNRAGTLGARYRDWAERLVGAGFVVLYPDSFGSRGL